MKRILHLLSILAVLSILAGGCARHEEMTGKAPLLNAYLHIPKQVLTRADVGAISAESEAENRISRLQLWVFLSEPCAGYPAGHLLGYLEPSPTLLESGASVRYAFPLEKAVADALPAVDVYALGNAPAVPLLDALSDPAALDALVLEGERFGIRGSLPVQTTVPVEGLPFSGVGKHLRMKGTYPVLTLDAIRLTRAVSKLRFVFSQLSDEAGQPVEEVAVTSIRLDGDRIPAREYLFNDSDLPWKVASGSYVSSGLELPVPETLALNPDPAGYAYTGQTAQLYENLIAFGLDEGRLTSGPFCYLRETDRKLSGQIGYTVGGLPGTASFEMVHEGDFARNHSWIVYLYFFRDAIRFTVSWTQWEEGNGFYLTD